MTYVLNVPGCATNLGSNTAIPDCNFAPDKFVGAILVDRNFEIAAADIDDIITTLQAACLATGNDRIHPVFRFEEIKDNSEAETVQTLGYGSKQVTKEGKYDWTFRQVIGGLCLQSRLRSFNNANKKVLLIDSDNVIWGTKTATGGMKGCTLDFFYAAPFKAADGTNAAIFDIRLALAKPEELNDKDKVAFVKVDVDVEENVKGNIDLELFELAKVAGKATIGIRTMCDKTDIYETFSTALASGTLWTCKKAGAAVTISGVVKNDTLGGWDVSFTGTGEHVIGLTTPALLAAANIGGAPENGYEGNTVAVTMPT